VGEDCGYGLRYFGVLVVDEAEHFQSWEFVDVLGEGVAGFGEEGGEDWVGFHLLQFTFSLASMQQWTCMGGGAGREADFSTTQLGRELLRSK
jgi:hypothetical protein